MDVTLGHTSVLVNNTASVIKCVSKCIIKWQIPNFRQLSKLRNGIYIESDVISHEGPDRLYQWKLCLYPQGCLAEDRTYISLFIKALESSENEIWFTFIIVNSTPDFIKKRGPRKYISEFRNYQGYRHFEKRIEVLDETKGLLSNDTLNLVCEIEIASCNPNHHIESRKKELDYSFKLNALEDYEKLFVSKKYSDVQFDVKGKTVLAHKIILSNRSSTIANMLEENDNIIIIDDVDHEVFKELLRFIYCGKVLDIESNVKDLLVAAHKYNVQNLKTMCEEYLSKNLSVDNALECLEIANYNECIVLERRTKDFIIAHADQMVWKPNFHIIGYERHEDLYLEVYRSLGREYRQLARIFNRR